MPEIDWTRLPDAVKQHLKDRLTKRHITLSDVQALQEWIRHSPQVPAGEWYKDFGTFKLCGEGNLPLTFLDKDQSPYGEEVE